MRNRGPMGTIAASPTMVGAVTTLIVIVAVFLAYNANSGLPFVPVYRVSVEVPDAARLTNNNEVRIGGHRVGVVESIDAVQSGEGTTTAQTGEGSEGVDTTGGAIAQLNLKLDESAGPLPRDSIFRVRYRSSFGLKYLEIVRGEGEAAPEGFTFDGTDDGATCALPTDPQQFSSSIPDEARNGCFQTQTEFDDINNTFDTETRTNARANLEGYGNAFAGRGTSLNDAINSLEPLFTGLRPLTRMLTEPETRFRRFFPELGDAARIVAPVAEEQAQLFTNMAIAFEAISSDPAALADTIAEGPPTLETGIRLLPNQRPFLREFTTLSIELRPGVNDLRATLPVLNEAIRVGTPVLADTVRTNRDLEDVFRELNQLVTQPTTKLTLRRLEDTFDTARPFAENVVPAQTVCNYLTYWGTFLPESLSDRDQVGFAHREILVGTPRGQTTVAAPGPLAEETIVIPGEAQNPMGGYAGLNANARHGATGAFEPYTLPITYGQAYGPAGQKGTNADCQGGQNGYVLGQLRVPGQPPSNPANIFSDLPGSRGPTTVFFDERGQRTLVDSRVDSRQPQSWGFAKSQGGSR
jgi:ABC-type transporter Mla subunit MlaD